MTLGKVMKKAGYATAMYGKWHVANNNKPEGHPMAFGFDDAIVSSGAHYKFKSTPPVDCPDDVSSTEFFTEKAIQFMDKAQAQKKPFFVFLPFFLVHGPQDCRADYIAHFQKKLADMNVPYDKEKEKDLPTVAAMTKLLDDCVGRLNNKVKSLGIEKDTLIVFTSDNGSYMQPLNGQFREKKGQVYEGGMRVPYIFKWPARIAAGSTSSERICGLDILPTLSAAAGVDVSQDATYDGVSLVDHLTNAKKLDARSIYCVYPKYARFSTKTKRWGDSWRHVVYNGDYKLIDYPEYDERELFNLRVDPQEKKELSKTEPEKLQTLTKHLQGWLVKIDSPKLVANPSYSLDKK
jgi:arylsulfatase A-like enzyme